MTTQLQPPVAVTPPLPTRRNAELLLLCFAALITVAALLIVEANQERGSALERHQLRPDLPARVRVGASGH